MKDLLKIADLNKADFEFLLEQASKFKLAPHQYITQLRGDILALYFTHPSTRTRLSFQTAIAHLGGNGIMLNNNDLQLGRGETIEDTAHIFSQYCRAVVIRTANDIEMQRFAKIARIPVINALSNKHHPCQALADILTIKEQFGTLKNIKLAYIGDGNNVLHSLIEAAALCDLELAIACPRGYEPARDILNSACELAAKAGNSINLYHSPHEALHDANVVYTDNLDFDGRSRRRKSRKVASFC
ncbi:MAG: ornithine carbamoyltransferase [Francisellaceae bacterium]|nr:ornithine carbamoyltransferase [Francisellaceae bacterium]